MTNPFGELLRDKLLSSSRVLRTTWLHGTNFDSGELCENIKIAQIGSPCATRHTIFGSGQGMDQVTKCV